MQAKTQTTQTRADDADASIIERVAMKLDRATGRLSRRDTFFTFFAYHLRRSITPDGTQTACTDGTQIKYNPAYVDRLSDRQTETLIAHEISHVLGKHTVELCNPAIDNRRANVAMDYVINLELLEAGYEPLPNWLLDERYAGLSWREVYVALGDEEPEPEPEPEDGEPEDGEPEDGEPEDGEDDADGSGTGNPSDDADGDADGSEPADCPVTGWCMPLPSDDDADDDADGSGMPDEAEIKAHEREIDTLIQEAAQSVKAVGSESYFADRYADGKGGNRINWRRELRRFVSRGFSITDYSLRRPNRRYVHTGLYMPSTVKESTGTIAAVIDTSGSVSQNELDAYAAELTYILKSVRPACVHVLYVDTEVCNVETFRRGQSVKLNPKGYGGTRFAPAFEHIQATPNIRRDLKAILYFTDGYNGRQDRERLAGMNVRIPTLWIYVASSWGRNAQTQPFGKTLNIDPYADDAPGGTRM